MSLNYNLSKIPNSKTFCWKEDGKDKDGKQLYSMVKLTEALVFLTMGIGLREITAKNAVEFYMRIRFYERIFGCYIRKTTPDDGEEDYFITLEDVKSHIGLSTNANDETKATWLKRMWNAHGRELEWQIRQKQKAAS